MSVYVGMCVCGSEVNRGCHSLSGFYLVFVVVAVLTETHVGDL